MIIFVCNELKAFKSNINCVHELVTIQNEGNSSVACSAARNIVSMQKWRSMMGLWRRLLFLDPLHPYPHHPEANSSCSKKLNSISARFQIRIGSKGFWCQDTVRSPLRSNPWQQVGCMGWENVCRHMIG